MRTSFAFVALLTFAACSGGSDPASTSDTGSSSGTTGASSSTGASTGSSGGTTGTQGSSGSSTGSTGTTASTGELVVFSDVSGANAKWTANVTDPFFYTTGLAYQMDASVTDQAITQAEGKRTFTTHVSHAGHYPHGSEPALVPGQAYAIGNRGSDTSLYGYLVYEEFDAAAGTFSDWDSSSGTVTLSAVTSSGQTYDVAHATMVPRVGTGAAGTFTLDIHGAHRGP